MEEKSQETYIRFEDVHVAYSDLVSGLKGVSLEIKKGEFVFLVGKTGSGKSTFLKLLTREVKPTSGSIYFNGTDFTRLPDKQTPLLRREMGIIPQDSSLLPNKRVWENIAYAMRVVGMSRSEVRRKVPEILERVNIGHRADAYPHELSGGEQQRVAIGRALVNNPTLLIADESTANLDVANSFAIMELLEQLNLRGTTVLVSTHEMDLVAKLNKRIIRLNDGKIEVEHA
jgi:cell division transport system ATP-binding protein